MKNHITLKQKIVEILAYVLMWASIVIGIIWSAKLPKEVATHFDAAGNADGYGSPYSFLFLPIIMLISCGISSLVLHFMPPDLWSMPVKVKPEPCGACVQRRCLDDGGDGILFWCIYAL